MSAGLRVFSRPWRAVDVRIASPAEPAALLSRMRHNVASDWALARGGRSAFRGSRVVKGRISGGEVCLYAGRRWVANSWRRFFVGSVAAADGGGSVISGKLRLHRFVAVFTTVWLSGLAIFCLIAIVGLVVSIARSDNAGTHTFLGATGVIVLTVSGVLAFFEYAFRLAAPDEDFLLGWLHQMAEIAKT